MEHHTTVIASRGQTMCLALDPGAGLALHASDSSAIQVPGVARVRSIIGNEDAVAAGPGHGSAQVGHLIGQILKFCNLPGNLKFNFVT